MMIPVFYLGGAATWAGIPLVGAGAKCWGDGAWAVGATGICWVMAGWGWVMAGWGWVVAGWGWVTVGWGWVVAVTSGTGLALLVKPARLAPHSGQNRALSDIFAPQYVQYMISPLIQLVPKFPHQL